VVAAGHVVVVGASAAGLSTAEALRREGFGGRITLVGSERVMPYDRPPLSKQFLAGEWAKERLFLRQSSFLDSLEVTFRLGETAVALDARSRTVRLDNDVELEFDRLVVATGVRPSVPAQWRKPGVYSLRTIDDAERLRAALTRARHVAIIGGGFIGCEAAASCVGLGIPATIIEPLEALMIRVVGGELAQMLTDVHRSHGVSVRCGVAVADIVSRPGGESCLSLTDGSTVEADVVVVGIGSTPNTGWLNGSGLSLTNGLDCDEYCRASESVSGAGDVASWILPRTGRRVRIEHRLHAVEQAHYVARSIVSDGIGPFDPNPFFWSDQYDLRVQSFGYLSTGASMSVIEGSITSRKLVSLYTQDDEVVGVLGINMPKETRVASRHLRRSA
jgi:3-phenylpropionate/trans-cinnamate dioxygenase ferredoxin reductase component